MRFNDMRNIVFFCLVIALSGCGRNNDPFSPPLAGSFSAAVWEKIKAEAAIKVEVPGYGTPYRQPLSTLGWEDSIHISRDGLYLYAMYCPGDNFSLVMNNDVGNAVNYLRGPTLGMDVKTNPLNLAVWLHADIVVASRQSLSEKFTSWTLSAMARPVYGEAGPFPFEDTGSGWKTFYYTCNDKSPTYDLDFWVISNSAYNPAGVGVLMPGFPHTANNEDNPHFERLSTNVIVLFFDSGNYTGGKGGLDIWYSVSSNNAVSWSTPQNVSSVTTSAEENQPHLFYDGVWYLYYSATAPDGRLAVYRAPQTNTNDWNSWGTRELVVSAGNCAAIGEPTLTSNGDISVVVIYANPGGSKYDKYDADPWFIPKQ
ncbi:MAG: hypothetical protein HZC28_17060 [Spirochaetes bacterium]|nr:hypothetical protein [Spirochaetota bacterium]